LGAAERDLETFGGGAGGRGTRECGTCELREGMSAPLLLAAGAEPGG
jgi:hypothetical protein